MATTGLALPRALSWEIAGRQGGLGARVLVDEIRMSDAALTPPEFLQCGSAEGATAAYYRFEEGAGGDITDEVTSAIHGAILAGASHSDDVPCPNVDGELNLFSLDCSTAGFARIFGVPFVLHDPSVTNGSGDATFECFFKKPAAQDHSALFWTNGDNAADASRFHLFWNASFTGAPDSDRFISSDYRAPDGAGPQAIANHNNGVPISLGEWHHLAIVRTDNGDGSYGWQWYVNGVANGGHSATTNLALPAALSWEIAGRSGGPSARLLVDEIRMTHAALGPADFLVCSDGPPCPEEGDTHCDGITVDPNGGVGGLFTITAEGTDDSDDDVFYTFIIETEGEDDIVVGPQTGNSISVTVCTPGIRGVTVRVDDDPNCEDSAEDAVCATTFEVTEACPVTSAIYRFEEGEGTEIHDELSGEVHGELVGGASFSPDVPCPDVGGLPNEGSLDCSGAGFARITGVAFNLHDPSVVSGNTGDATFECFFKKPAGQDHSAIFWTNGDNGANTNRFNLFWNASFTGAPDSDRFISADYLGPNGAGTTIVQGGHNTGNPVELGLWHHLAIVRTDNGDGTFNWQWYFNGTASGGHTATTEPALPTAMAWEIGGRQGGAGARILVDEIRMSNVALPPEEFLLHQCGDCPVNGDTNCNGVTVDPNGGAGGVFTITADAEDDSDDAIFYTFTLDDGDGNQIVFGPQLENSVSLTLCSGSWDVTVEVDDDLACDDATDNTTCTTSFEVTAPCPPTVAYYRFEDDGGGEGIVIPSIIDSVSGDVHGELLAGALLSDDVPPCLATGDNASSLDLSGEGFAKITGAPFVLHDESLVGSDGDATFECFLKKPAAQGHTAIFWSNGDNAADANRFNLFWNASFTGAPDSDRFISSDYRAPDGSGPQEIANHNNGLPIALGEWYHFAIVRTKNGDGTYNWEWFFNGEPSGGHMATTSLALPNATSWEIGARSGGPAARVLVDEIRMSRVALTPEEFLYCPPCPDEGDTICNGLAIDPAGPVGVPGNYTVTADAEDASGDSISYVFTADNGVDPPTVIGPQAASSASFDLGLGFWTISVAVDDDPDCDDTSDGATCAIQIEIVPPCPEEGDTICNGLTIDPEGDTGNPGTFTVTADAEDASGDDITYVFTADNGIDPPTVVGPQASESASFDLDLGSWIISVSVDDDPECDDVAEGASCSIEIEIVPEGGLQVPGDCNQDGVLDISDGLCLLGHLFLGNPVNLPCDGDGANQSLLDWQPDGGLDLSDGIGLLNFLFTGGPPHPSAVEDAETTGCIRMVDCPDNDNCS